jgi:uncharacterized HAD superfamily protein
MEKVVGLDIDGVLAHWQEEFVRWYNDNHDESIHLNHFRGEQQDEVILGVTTDELMALYDSFSEDRLAYVKPNSEAQLYVERAPHKFVAITRRPDSTKQWTEPWLKEHFDIEDVHFTTFSQHGFKQVSKGEVCVDLGVEFFVEDTPKHAIDVAQNGVTSLLFHRPWNEHVELPNEVDRVYSWADISAFIDE